MHSENPIPVSEALPRPGTAQERANTASAGAKPVVVALIGLPGAGKSVVARAIEDQLGLRRVCRDAIRHAMFPKCSYSFAEKRSAFRSMLLALEINCMLGESSVIGRYGFTPISIFLDCPPDVARERIASDVANDRHLARDRTPDVVSEVLVRFDPPPPTALLIDANQPAADVCRLAIETIAAIRGEGLRNARGAPGSRQE